MIALGVILLIISIFAARNILLPLGLILILLGLVLWAFQPGYTYY